VVRTVLTRMWSALRRETGFALPMALGISVLLGMSVVSMVDYTAADARSTNESGARALAYTSAERGMNDALAVLFYASSPHQTTALPSYSSPLTRMGQYRVSYSYTGTLVDPVWTIAATATIQNVTQGSRPITKTLKRTLRITAGAAGAGPNMTIWNYIYSDAPPTDPCMPLANNSAISSPLYVRGNLCLSNNAHVDRNDQFSSLYPGVPQLQVGGWLTLGNGTTHIGTSAAPLNGVQTPVGCGSPAHACTTADAIYASSYPTAPPSFTKPVIDLNTWYNDAAPGPKHPCTTPPSTGTPPVFDNNAALDNSVGNVNLTPATAYDCKFVDSVGTVLGELKWTPGSPGALFVQGTVYFDGNLSLGTQVVYSGRGTIYFTGSISYSNNAYLCGIVNCTSAWDANANLLVLVAGSNAVSPSYAVSLSNNAVFQGAVEANGDFSESNNVGIWGSVIAHQVYLSNNAINHYVPFGTPVPGLPAESAYMDTLQFTANSFSD
jgi:Tfp pilus assembly protein PilX